MNLKKDAQRIYEKFTGNRVETDYKVKKHLADSFNYQYLLEFLHQEPSEKNRQMIDKIQSIKSLDDFQDFMAFLHFKSLIQSF